MPHTETLFREHCPPPIRHTTQAAQQVYLRIFRGMEVSLTATITPPWSRYRMWCSSSNTWGRAGPLGALGARGPGLGCWGQGLWGHSGQGTRVGAAGGTRGKGPGTGLLGARVPGTGLLGAGPLGAPGTGHWEQVTRSKGLRR